MKEVKVVSFYGLRGMRWAGWIFPILIKWFSRAGYWHSGIAIDGKYYEVIGTGVRKFEYFPKFIPKVKVDTYLIDEEFANAGAKYLEECLAKKIKYDWLGILGIVLDGKTNSGNRLFCSEMVSKALYEIKNAELKKVSVNKIELDALPTPKDSERTAKEMFASEYLETQWLQ